MTSDVVLSAALRNNLLSLQNTQGLIDKTQMHLSTGKKINSALDGPQSFFAAQALNNRAGDLNRLLDAIGQSIQTIKTADNGVTALTTLVQQADSVAAAARDAIAKGQAEAKAVGSENLRDIDDLTTLSGVTAGDTLVFTITDSDGSAVTLGAYGGASGATATVAIAANDSTEDLVNKINNLHLDDGAGNAMGAQAFEAKVDDKGQLQIRTLNGGDFNLNFVATVDADAANLALSQSLGFGSIARLVPQDGVANDNNVEVSSLADVALRSFSLIDNTTGAPAQASALLSNIEDDLGTPLFANINNAADQYVFSVNGGPQQTIDLFQGGASISIQKFVDSINGNGTLNAKIKATYDDTTGVLTITPIDGSVKSIEIGVNDAVTANFGFGVNTDLTALAGESDMETIRLASASAELAQLETDFNNLRDQIDLLVSDTGYRGTNLLNGNDLLTVFNEDRTSVLTTRGVTFTASGLGMTQADFSRSDTIETAITQVRTALSTVRAFGSTLANDLSIIQTREDYTKNLVNTLTEGADKLTNADQNEEGAKLLALQTRQQLGVTALSLASQSQQSILKLFG